MRNMVEIVRVKRKNIFFVSFMWYIILDKRMYCKYQVETMYAVI